MGPSSDNRTNVPATSHLPDDGRELAERGDLELWLEGGVRRFERAMQLVGAAKANGEPAHRSGSGEVLERIVTHIREFVALKRPGGRDRREPERGRLVR